MFTSQVTLRFALQHHLTEHGRQKLDSIKTHTTVSTYQHTTLDKNINLSFICAGVCSRNS